MSSEWVAEYIDAWNSHDGTRIASFMATDARYEDLAAGELHAGPAAIGAFFESGLEFSNDHQYTLVSEHSTPDRFVIEWEMAGTHTGDAGGKGFVATNKPYRIRGISTGWLDSHGKITTNRDYWNLADLLMQIGVLPLPTT